MAETKKEPAASGGKSGQPKKAGTGQKTSSKTAKTSTAPSAVVTQRANSTAPKKQSTTKKSKPTAQKSKPTAAATTKPRTGTATGKKSAADRAADEQKRQEEALRRAARAERWSTFSKQFLPYILGAVSLFLMVTLVVDAIGGETTPSEHLMGYVGYYICEVLFGCLGWVAYLLPAVLLTLTVFWRRYYRTGRVVGKVVLSVVLLVLLSATGHVFLCAGDETLAAVYNPALLYTRGAAFESGGVVGGLLGYVLYLALRVPGTVALDVVTLPLIGVCLVGLTPMDVIARIGAAIKEKRALREAEAEDEDEAEDEEAEVGRSSKKSRRAEQYESDEEGDSPAEPTENEDEAMPVSTPARPLKKREEIAERAERTERTERTEREEGDRDGKKGRYMRVNIDTGELDEAYDAPDEADSSGKKAHANGQGDRSDDRSDAGYSEASGALPVHERSRADGRRPVSAVEIVSPERASVARNDRRFPAGSTDDDDKLPWEEDAAHDVPSDGPSDGPSDVPSDEWDDRESLPAGNPPDGDLPDGRDEDDGYDEDGYDEDDGMDSMEVDFEDEPEATPDTETLAARRVTHKGLQESDSPEAAASGKTTVTVRILKSESSAVDEGGLSEEELVLPSGHGSTPDEPMPEAAREYCFPSIDMLTRGPGRYEANEEEIAENTEILRDVLESFRIRVRDISCSCGPTITRFEVKPESGVRVRSIANLVDDIAMNLAKSGVRIEAPIPGKNAVGIEVPNAEPSTVYLRNILETPEFRNHKSRIAACLGADVSGRPVIMDINKMPHLLIAGATGMGKSVCINSIIMSILYKAKPDEVKLILIDPKKVEFAMYRGLPHLYAPIVSDPKKAAGALNSAVNEMERRFELIEEVGVRNIAGYNEITAGDPERPPLPQMVIIIDELADLMMTAPADVETAICRLAQKARAAGIHLVIGTQRPSVDVITGLIKANIPSRIAFTVASAVDSRTIIDTVGADKLIGRGDMLYAPVGSTKPMRAQGTFVSESEVERVVTFIKENNDPPAYSEDFTRNIEIEAAKCGVGKKKGGADADDFAAIGARNDGEDPKFWEALEIVVTKEKIGTSALQRGCNLGYGRAAKIIDRMEELGFVGPDDGTKQGRKVYITKQNLVEYKLNGLPGNGRRDEDEENPEA